MRLGQLSRKLDVTISDIINYLSENGIEVNEHPNVKLDEETEAKVINAFSPKGNSLISNEPAEIVDEREEEVSTETSQLEKITEPEPEISEEIPAENEIEQTTIEPSEEEPEEEIAVIKTPKIKLQGLKVVGKIDLPEPKSKEPEKKPEPKEEDLDLDKVKIVRHSYKNKRRKFTEEEWEERRIRNKKAKQHREEAERKKRKKHEEQAKKRKKQQHYLERIQKEQTMQQKNKKKKKKSRKPVEVEPQDVKPKTVLGKFWRWLNT